MISKYLSKEAKKAIQNMATKDELLECGLRESTVKVLRYRNFILSDEKIDCLIKLMSRDLERGKYVRVLVSFELQKFENSYKAYFTNTQEKLNLKGKEEKKGLPLKVVYGPNGLPHLYIEGVVGGPKRP